MNEKTKNAVEAILILVVAFGSLLLAAVFSTGIVVMVAQGRISEIPVAYWSIFGVAVAPYIKGVKEIVTKLRLKK